MNPLNPALYEPILQENELDYKFLTKDGIWYDVAVDYDMASYFPGKSFANNAINIAMGPEEGSSPSPQRDPDIAVAMEKIMTLCLNKKPDGVFVYTCSLKDGQEAARGRVFDNMFALSNRNSIYKRQKFKNKKRRLYGSLLYKEGNPAEPDIVLAAQELAQY